MLFTEGYVCAVIGIMITKADSLYNECQFVGNVYVLTDAFVQQQCLMFHENIRYSSLR